MIVDIEIVGIEGVGDTIRDMEGGQGIEAVGEDSGSTVTNDMENGRNNQQPDLVRVLPLDAPDSLILVESDDRNTTTSVGGDDLDNSVASLASKTRDARSRLGGQSSVGIPLATVARRSLVIRVITAVQRRSTGDKTLPVGMNVMQGIAGRIGGGEV
jgi:hypothetical protein